MGMFSTLRSFLSSIMTRTPQDTSAPRPAPRNNYLFYSSVVVGGHPGQLLEIFRRECERLGVDLSLENRVTKIEYCKAPEAPYHEFMMVYVAWVTPDGQLSDEHRCLISAERFSKQPPGYEDIGALQGRATSGSVTSTSAAPASGIVSESTSQSPSVPVADKAATTKGTPPRRPEAGGGVKASLARSSRDSASSSFQTDAWDVIRINPAPLRDVKNKATLTFPPSARFNVERLACIMNVVHQEAPTYNPFATQCYWYARCTWDIIISICAKEPATEPLHDHESDMAKGMMGYWVYKYTGKFALFPETIRSPQLVRKDAKGPFLLESESSSAFVERCETEWAYWKKAFKESSQLRRKREEHIAQMQAQLSQKDEDLAKRDEDLAKRDEDLAKKDEFLAAALADKADAFARIAALEAQLAAQSH
ncbi:hypothetical protein CPB85DRAFT_461727 [Mucidula mucida]|nr:hypothetical protein CPB85DRAFT_461727 [Mucidula mucida]